MSKQKNRSKDRPKKFKKVAKPHGWTMWFTNFKDLAAYFG